MLISFGGYEANAGAYSGILQTADALPESQYRLGVETFVSFDGGGQFNALAHLDYGLLESISLLTLAGSGSAEFQGGAGAKWNIFPDASQQIAFSVTGLGKFVRSGVGFMVLEIYPTVSKALDSSRAQFIPYASIQPSLVLYSDTYDIPWNLVVGTQVKPTSWRHLRISGEVGVNLRHSVSYVSILATIDLNRLAHINDMTLP